MGRNFKRVPPPPSLFPPREESRENSWLGPARKRALHCRFSGRRRAAASAANPRAAALTPAPPAATARSAPPRGVPRTHAGEGVPGAAAASPPATAAPTHGG